MSPSPSPSTSTEPVYVEDIDAFLDGYMPPEDSVPICMRGDLQSRFEGLEQQLQDARRRPDNDSLGGGGEVRRIAEEIEALRQEMQRHVRWFLLRGLPKKAWSDLVKDHPPRKEDLPADHNRETFPVEALAACSVKPKMSVEKAGKLVDRVTNGQWNVIWGKILELNAGGGEVPFSVASSAILSSTRMS